MHVNTYFNKSINKIKILILNYEFPPLGGGAGNATYYLLKEFSKNKNISVDLITSSTDKYKEEDFSPNIKIYYLDIGKNNRIHYQSNIDLLRYTWKAYKKAKLLIKTKQFNLVHAFFGIPCGWIAMKLKLSYIVSLRGSDVPFYNPRFKLLDKLIFKQLSKKIWKKSMSVITNSEGLKKLANSSSPEQNINVIYNGVDTNEFTPKDTVPNKFTILSTSRLIKRKGIEHLVAGFNKLHKKTGEVKLILVGDGNLKDEIKQQIKNYDLIDFVKMRGSLPHDKLASIYHKADVFVLPSLNEGMSNSILEAMACGLPIITTDTGGSKELIDDENGFIIKKSNSEEIFNALLKLENNLDLRKKMGTKSRNKALDMDWSNAAKKYYNIYKKYFRK